jgi:hypothetical protein
MPQDPLGRGAFKAAERFLVDSRHRAEGAIWR